jgi:hypothetical protein
VAAASHHTSVLFLTSTTVFVWLIPVINVSHLQKESTRLQEEHLGESVKYLRLLKKHLARQNAILLLALFPYSLILIPKPSTEQVARSLIPKPLREQFTRTQKNDWHFAVEFYQKFLIELPGLKKLTNEIDDSLRLFIELDD